MGVFRYARRSTSLGAAVLAAGLALPPSAGAESPGAGASQTGVLTREPARIPLDIPDDSYVQGTLSAEGAALTLLQLGADGMPRRQLTQGEGKQVFRLMATVGDTLAITGAAGTAYDLRIDRIDRAPEPASGAGFLSPAIAALADSLATGGETAAFWAERAAEGTPMLETVDGQTVMTFLHRGAQRNVRLLGGPSSDHDWLERLGTSDVWFRSYAVPATTRLAYRLAPDVPDIAGSAPERRAAILATAAADPLNRAPWPLTAPDRFGTWSTVALPGAPEQPGFPVTGIDRDQLQETRIRSAILGNSRSITFYRPRGFDPADPDALLLFVFDGPRAISEMQVPGALETLIARHRLPPVAAVFIDPIDTASRSRELPGNPRFADFLADELLPLALDHFGLTTAPPRTILAGASYGGIGASAAALSRPDSFGAAISMSGSYWWSPETAKARDLPWLAETVLAGPPRPVRFFVAAGTFETSRDGTHDIRETSKLVYGLLKARGYDATWREYAAGHDSFVWRGTLMDGLIEMFGL